MTRTQVLFLLSGLNAYPGWAQAPDALIGEWSKSHVSTVDFVNPNTGSHASPSSVFGEKVGMYQVEGDKLSMKDSASVLTSKDNCHPQWNYEKHPPLAQTTYQWRLSQTKYGLALIMLGPDGKETMYLREKEPGLLSR